MVEAEELLTVEQAQARLGVSRATFYNLIKRHQIPSYTLPLDSKRVYFKPEDLDRLKQPVRREPEPTDT